MFSSRLLGDGRGHDKFTPPHIWLIGSAVKASRYIFTVARGASMLSIGLLTALDRGD